MNAAGEMITYTFAIRNTGNVTVHEVTAEETAFSGTGRPSRQLGARARRWPRFVGRLHRDLHGDPRRHERGNVVNTARATGADPADAAVTSALSATSVTANTDQSQALGKSAHASSYNAVGTDQLLVPGDRHR